MKTTDIQEKYRNTNQAILFTGIYELISKTGIHSKVMVDIKNDSYDAQSYAKIQTWTPAGWVFVTSLNWKDTRSQEIFNQKKVESFTTREFRAFQADKDQLLVLADKII
jgi:hypothetical protein